MTEGFQQLLTTHHNSSCPRLSHPFFQRKERDKRKLNLILHNIPESTNPSSDVRKQDNTDTAAAIFNQHLGIPTSATNTTSLRKKGTKPRILRVTVSSERDKGIILQNCTKVRSITGADYLKNSSLHPT